MFLRAHLPTPTLVTNQAYSNTVANVGNNLFLEAASGIQNFVYIGAIEINSAATTPQLVTLLDASLEPIFRTGAQPDTPVNGWLGHLCLGGLPLYVNLGVSGQVTVTITFKAGLPAIPIIYT